MHKLKALTLVVLFLNISASAQIGNDPIGARSNSLGGYSATLSDIWSVNNNQAGLAFITELQAGIYYENRFLLKETGYKSGALVLPVKSGAFGIHINSFGFELFNETKAGLSYGQRFGDQFSMGIQLNYLNTNLPQEYGNKNSLTAAIGLMAKLTTALTLGVHVYNPTRNKLANFDNERIPTIMKLGLDYRFSEKVMLAVETEKDVDFDALLRLGIEYHITEVFYLRGGVSTNSTQNTFGIGILLKDFKLNVSSSFHQTLGLTPGISLIYTKSK